VTESCKKYVKQKNDSQSQSTNIRLSLMSAISF
jgi:hypothetical protein